MNLFKKLKYYAFTLSILYIIVGIIMIANPKFVCDAVNYIIGSLIILYGIIYLLSILSKKNEFFNKFNFLGGVMCIGFGVFLILNSHILTSLIPFCSGVIIFVDAVCQLRNSFSLKKYDSRYWWINLIVGFLFLIFSVYVMIKAEDISMLIIQITGGVLILDGMMDFYTYFLLKKYNNRVVEIEKKLIEEK